MHMANVARGMHQCGALEQCAAEEWDLTAYYVRENLVHLQIKVVVIACSGWWRTWSPTWTTAYTTQAPRSSPRGTSSASRLSPTPPAKCARASLALPQNIAMCSQQFSMAGQHSHCRAGIFMGAEIVFQHVEWHAWAACWLSKHVHCCEAISMK